MFTAEPSPTWLQSLAIYSLGLLGGTIVWADPAQYSDDDRRTQAVLKNQVELQMPTEAILHGIGGTVEMRLQIDASGQVTKAEQISGSELFHATAMRTAMSLRFQPALENGSPIPSELVIVFDYGPVHSRNAHHHEMVIEHEDLGPPETHAVDQLTEAELRRNMGQDLGETISISPGVTMARGTGDTSKPIIRGLTERRLLIINDGVRHESQKWGADHAPEIDPNSAGRITIIKGASGVRYGPDALAGVILVEPHALRTETGIGGTAKGAFASNGQRGFGAVRLDARSEQFPHLGLRVEGNYQLGAALSSPHYVLGNTASETWNGGATLGYRHGETSVKLRYQHFQSESGVFYGIQNSTIDEFTAQLDRDVPITAHLWDTTRNIDRPYQGVRHDLALAHAETSLGSWGHLHTTYAFQRNDRTEYEQARSSITGPQYQFLLRTHTLNMDLEHVPIFIGNATLEGGSGLAGSFQENVYSGYTLIPNYRAFGGGVFAHERLTWNRAAVDLGGRFDHLSRSAFLEERFYDSHVRRGTLNDSNCDTSAERARCPSTFNAASISIGGLWQVVDEHIELKVDLSSASRVPNADEAYMLSSAPTMPVYVYSDPSLGVETTWGASPTLGLEYSWFHAEVSAYANVIQDFIYFAPELDADGNPSFDVTIRGAFPRYSYRAIDAQFHGLDGSLVIGPNWWVAFQAQGSIVRATDMDSGIFLVGTPADRLQVNAIGQWADLGPMDDLRLSVGVEGIAEQSRVDPANDIAPPPPGATLVHASFGSDILFGAKVWQWGIEGHNLLNTAYREYTSLLRYYADQPGRDIRLHISTDF